MLIQTLHEEPYLLAVKAPATTLARQSLARTLSCFAPVSLEEMQDVALLRRIDTKMVLREAQLVRALARLSDDYEVLDIEGRRIHRYQTLYFDTPDYALYHQHHNGRRERYKVRARAYEDSGLAFLEVKRKTNQDVTVKERLPIPGITTQISRRGSDFLASIFPYPAAGLVPALWNQFQRITLVSKHRAERLTLDIGLSFRVGQAGQREIALPGVVIAEIKQSVYALRSEFIGQLRQLGVRPMSFSKYCVGVSLLVPQVKHNHFKPQQVWLNHIIQESR